MRDPPRFLPHADLGFLQLNHPRAKLDNLPLVVISLACGLGHAPFSVVKSVSTPVQSRGRLRSSRGAISTPE